MIMVARRARARGITLTEILIAIMIMGVGLVSLATLFPLGLLRLRDAARYSRSAYLSQSAAADVISRSLLLDGSFAAIDLQNNGANPQIPFWYTTNPSLFYNPFTRDTPYYGADWLTDPAGPGADATVAGGGGLPIAYDPLWRYQTVNPGNTQANGAAPVPPGGYYVFDNNSFEARFGAGDKFLRNDLDGNPASAYGLQRISNFNRPYYGVDAAGNPIPLMPASLTVPTIFVSPEDVVWQDPTNQSYSIAGNVVSAAAGKGTPGVGTTPSPVLPDLSISPWQTVTDWRYSWMFTGQLTNAANHSCFDGSLVIFENRPFAIAAVTGPNGAGYQVDGETVVEAIFGHSGNINANGYATGADRTVLLRWNSSLPDPVVKGGDWIADITYERNQSIVISRWWQTSPAPLGVANPTNNNEWDNLPAQRCYWYQVQKVTPAVPDPYLGNTYRSMVVYVNQSLISRTVLSAVGTPIVMNAALIAPNVVNVIPQTFFTR
jgi:type II secretory pathway pseudopilin PulG